MRLLEQNLPFLAVGGGFIMLLVLLLFVNKKRRAASGGEEGFGEEGFSPRMKRR
jgi:LPXTG-motif cell wall-anchored protein